MNDETEPPDDEEPQEPRLRIVKGSPWTITGGRRAKWSSDSFVERHAVDIRQVGDPILHAAARKPRLAKGELEALIGRMFASMLAARGIGIAAPQIGVPLRICIIDVEEAGIVAMDPAVDWVSDEVEEASEGCLSVRGMYGYLERPVSARLVAADPLGRRFALEGDGVGAQCILHETDHLAGVLYVDRLRSRADDLFPVERPVPGAEELPLTGRRREPAEVGPSD
jgi:peptide deformylase